MSTPTLKNYIGGQWLKVAGVATVPVFNPATGSPIAQHPMSDDATVDQAVDAAAAAFEGWRRTPVPTRAAAMFRYRALLTNAIEELAGIITDENGKTLDESRGELVRAIQYVEHAAAAPELMKGSASENIGTAVDIMSIREPLGVFAIVAPFNFPAMIPLYFTWAVATGNTVIVKPSEHCPLTTIRMVELAEEAGFPAGVINVVLGGPNVVDRLARHPEVAGLSFVGSSDIAKLVYTTVTGEGKRCQAQGGAKNHLIVSDTAVLDRCGPNIVSSMFGNASQRCFAGSNLLVMRSRYDEVLELVLKAAGHYQLGSGRDPATTLGPVINQQSRDRFIAAIDQAESEGAEVLLDGRGASVAGFDDGFWLGPTLIRTATDTAIFTDELFGPVRCIHPIDTLDEAIDIVNASSFGHTAAIYTELGGEARELQIRADVGQIGVNIGTPAPIAFYAVGGRRSSFYGDLRGRANDAVDFYTDKKVVVSTWHANSSEAAGIDPVFEGEV
ncbi:MAG: CoA-acylating methylmalonate-semialdehyde dehydrogenase [Acidimicrobiales bacterium]